MLAPARPLFLEEFEIITLIERRGRGWGSYSQGGPGDEAVRHMRFAVRKVSLVRELASTDLRFQSQCFGLVDSRRAVCSSVTTRPAARGWRASRQIPLKMQIRAVVALAVCVQLLHRVSASVILPVGSRLRPSAEGACCTVPIVQANFAPA